MPQMSAPIAPPHDFTQALHGSMNGSSSRTSMRDSFGSGPLSMGQGQGSNEKSDEHSQDGLSGLKRKRSSFSLSQGPHTSGSAQSSQNPYDYPD